MYKTMKMNFKIASIITASLFVFALQSCEKEPVNTTPSYKATADWQLNSMVETIHEASTGTFMETNTETYVPGELSMHIKTDGTLDLYEGAAVTETYPYSIDYSKKFMIIYGMDWGNDTFFIQKLDATNLQLKNEYVDTDYDEKVTTLLNMTKK